MDKAQEIIEELQERLLEKEKEIKLLEMKMNEYERRLMEAQRGYEVMKSELENKQKQIQGMVVREKHLQESIAVLNEDRDVMVTNLKGELNKLGDENIAMAEELDYVLSKKHSQERPVNRWEIHKTPGPLRKALYESEEEKMRISRLLAQLKVEYEKLLKSSHDMELHIHKNNDQIYQDLKEKCELLVAENERLHLCLKELQKKCEHKDDKIKKIERDLSAKPSYTSPSASFSYRNDEQSHTSSSYDEITRDGTPLKEGKKSKKKGSDKKSKNKEHKDNRTSYRDPENSAYKVNKGETTTYTKANQYSSEEPSSSRQGSRDSPNHHKGSTIVVKNSLDLSKESASFPHESSRSNYSWAGFSS